MRAVRPLSWLTRAALSPGVAREDLRIFSKPSYGPLFSLWEVALS